MAMKRDFSALQDSFDLLICGGGIYGAWTAYDAALRGLKVALVERGDWGSATSSASSKLIHGGLRYLETFDFKLVRKALRERRSLLQTAPHRVWPLRFGVPVYAGGGNGPWKLKVGLTLYDMLAGFPEEPGPHRFLKEAAFRKSFPFLKRAGLKSGFTYGDTQTDDARLVLELVGGALDLGAVCVNYAELVEWNLENGHVAGATVEDRASGARADVKARECVSTAGQWSAAIPEAGPWCRLSKGVHLVLPALPTREALLLTAESDGRVFFLIPWYGRTLVGTTDTDYRGGADGVTVEAADVDYLLAAAGTYLETPWTRRDVVGAFAGLRVMKQSTKASPSDVSRDWELKTAPSGLRYSIGGKITSAREDAASIVDAICAAMGVRRPCLTRDRDFPWRPPGNFAAWSREMRTRAQSLGIDAESAECLLRRHGSRIARLFPLIEEAPGLAGRLVPDLPFIEADLLFCAREEMALHLSDLVRRRMPLSILARLDSEYLHRLADRIAPTLRWDPARVAWEVRACADRPDFSRPDPAVENEG
jgi:glycerol-3-phosphate dehydrogenase